MSVCCKICEEPYEENGQRVPRILSECGHTICEFCAYQMVNDEVISCPFDRTETIVADGILSNLKKNFGILEAMEEYKVAEVERQSNVFTENKNASDPRCGEDQNHLAEVYCTNCKANFCHECSSLTHSTKLLSAHKIVKVSEKPEDPLFCPHHPFNVAELFCTEEKCKIDNKLMCANCHLYGIHKGHKFETIHSIYEVKHKSTQDLLIKTKLQLKVVRSSIDKIAILPDCLGEDEEYIDRKKKLDEEYENALGKLVEEVSDKIEKRQKEMEEYMTTFENLESFEKLCSDAQDNGMTGYFEKLVEIEAMATALGIVVDRHFIFIDLEPSETMKKCRERVENCKMIGSDCYFYKDQQGNSFLISFWNSDNIGEMSENENTTFVFMNSIIFLFFFNAEDVLNNCNFIIGETKEEVERFGINREFSRNKLFRNSTEMGFIESENPTFFCDQNDSMFFDHILGQKYEENVFFKRR